MKLYHGSSISGITALRPALSNHGTPYVYLTDDPALAVLYAHNPLTPPDGYFPYFYNKNGILCYDEYFPDALSLYKGFGGYVYTAEVPDTLPRLERMPWVYLSQAPVPVSEYRAIPDLYAELLRLEQEGKLIVNRFGSLSEARLQGIYKMLRRKAEQKQLKNHPEREYAQFFQAHFPFLL